MPEFKLLGPTEVRDDHGRSRIPRGPKIRQVLALLIMNAGRVVEIDSFVCELWGERAQKAEIKTLRTHVYLLRRFLDGLSDDAGPLLVTQAPGYVLRVDRAEIDALVFPGLVERASADYRAGRHHAAELVLRDALGMWSGPALADIRLGPMLAPRATALEEQRVRALELHVEARLRQGLHGEIIDDLRLLVAAHPLHENFHAQLITALSGAGRRTDAHRAYEGLRALLDAELGVAPSFHLHSAGTLSGEDIR